MELQELIDAVTEVAASLEPPLDLDATLDRLTRSAADTIPGIDHVSISLTGKDGTIRTLAPTTRTAVEADGLQYALCEGPCYDAVTTEPVVQVDDLAVDLRWPAYGPKAAATFGLGAQVAFQFHAEPHAHGALNLYANQVGLVDVETRQVGMMYARLVAIALGWSYRDNTLTEALTTRTEIGQAVGILMERYRLDPDRAFSFLIRTSQTTNVKLHNVAAGIVADATAQAARG